MTSIDTGANGADSMDTATDFFERMMDSAEGRTTGSHEQDVEDAESDELEAEQDETSEDDDTDAEHDGDDEEDDESESDEEDEPLSERELNRKVPVTDKDGHTVYKTVRELMNDGLRQSDYTRKTQELAAERQKIAEQAAHLEAVRQERAFYQEQIEAHQRQLVESFQPLTDEQWKYLRENDPLEYTIRKQDLIDRREAYAQAEQQKQYLQQKNAYEQQQQFQTTVSNEFGKLYEAHPEWRDQKVWARVKNDIVEYGKRIGYSEQELKSATDSRAILALHQAMVAEKVRNAKPARNTNDVKAPKQMPASAATANKPRAKTELAKAQQRLSKSGSVQDAADIFLKGGFV